MGNGAIFVFVLNCEVSITRMPCDHRRNYKSKLVQSSHGDDKQCQWFHLAESYALHSTVPCIVDVGIVPSSRLRVFSKCTQRIIMHSTEGHFTYMIICVLYWNVPYRNSSYRPVAVCVCVRRQRHIANLRQEWLTDSPEMLWVCWVSLCQECIKFWLRTN